MLYKSYLNCFVYYFDLISNSEKQEAVKRSGIALSVGSDTHWVGDFDKKRLVQMFIIDMAFCTYNSVFENELGEYGVYLDGNECFVSSQDKNQNVDIRIALLNPESYERVDMISFSDDVQ